MNRLFLPYIDNNFKQVYNVSEYKLTNIRGYKMDTKTRIFESTIFEAKENYIFKISTIAVSKKASTSESNLYKIFKSKNNLLIETFLYIDEQVGEYIVNNVPMQELKTIEDCFVYAKAVWTSYIHFFVNHDAYCSYYSAFRSGKLYTKEIEHLQEEHFKNLLNLFQYIYRDLKVFETISFNLLWSFILDTTLMIAKRMSAGEVEYTPQNIEMSYHLMFDGLINILVYKRKCGEK